MKFNTFAIMNYNAVNDPFHHKPSDKVKAINAAKLKLKYNVAVDKALYNVLGNDLYDLIEESLETIYGGIDNTFYDDFPAGVPNNYLVRFLNQFLHYVGVADEPVFEEDKEVIVPETDYSKKLLASPNRTLTLTTKEEVLDRLLTHQQNLSDEAYNQVLTLVKALKDYQVDFDKITARKTAMVALYALLNCSKGINPNDYKNAVQTLSDALKYVEVAASVHNEGKVLASYNLKYEPVGMRTRDYNVFFKLIGYAVDNQGIENFMLDIKPNIGTLKKICYLTRGKHYPNRKDLMKLLYNTSLDSIYKLADRYIENGKYVELAINYPTMFIRKYTTLLNQKDYKDSIILNNPDAKSKLLTVPTRVLLQLYNRLNRGMNTPNVYDLPTGYYADVEEIKNYKQSRLITGLLRAKLISNEDKAYHRTYSLLQDEYIKSNDDGDTFSDFCAKFDTGMRINYKVSTTSKDVSSLLSIPYSRFPIRAHKLGVYLKWYDDIDLDLSVDFQDNAGNTGHLSYYRDEIKDIDGLHSGDIVRNPDTSKPVSERVIFDLDKAAEKYKYIYINAYVYNGDAFSGDKPATLGLQDVSNYSKEDALGNNLEDNIIDTTPDTPSKAFTWIIIDLATMEAIVVNKPVSVRLSNMNSVYLEQAEHIVADFVTSIAYTDMHIMDLLIMLPLTKHHENILKLCASCPRLAKVYLEGLVED